MTSAIAQLFHFNWLAEAILKCTTAARRQESLSFAQCLAHLNIQKSL